MLAACTSSQKPYSIAPGGGGAPYTTGTGHSAADACRMFASAYGGNVASITDHTCQISSIAGTFTVVPVCDASPQLTPDKIADMSALWGLFLVVAIVILGLRKLYDVFDKAPHGD